MTEKMTRNQIVNLYKMLNERAEAKFNPKFSFFVLRNVKFLEAEIAVIDETNTSLQSVLTGYETERSSILDQLADKDEDGNLILLADGQSAQIIENKTEFADAMEQLTDKFEKEITEYNVLSNQLNELFSEEVEQQVLKISYLDIPSEEFTIAELNNLNPLIKETEEELDEMIMG